MTKSSWVARLFALLLLLGGITSAHAMSKVAFLPSTTNQALTRAWYLSIGYTLKWKLIELQVRDPAMKAETQVAMMNDLIDQGYHAIILQPIDAGKLLDGVKRAEEKGIHVVTLNTNVAHPHAAHVTMDDYGAGVLVGGIVGKSIDGKGNVAIIQSPPGALAGVEREKGFREAVAKQFPDIKVVAAQNGEWRKDKAAEIMKGYLQQHSQLDAVFAVNDNMAEGAMTAAETAGRLDKVKIWGFNGQKSTLTLIEEGKITGSAYTNAYKQGATAAIRVIDLLSGKKSKGATTETITIPPFAATKESVRQIESIDRW